MTCQPAPAVVTIVGAGPRGVGVLERLHANAPELLADAALEIHLVDPYPPGGGRVWRAEQSPLLWLNSTAGDVTFFTDDSVDIEGPVRPGPTLAEWATDAAAGLPSPPLAREAAELGPHDFPSRRLGSEYLRWFYEQVVADLPTSTRLVVHPQRALDVEEASDGRQRVRLADGSAIDTDVVVLTIGHLDAAPDGALGERAEFAARHGLTYLPPGYGADLDLTRLSPDVDVIVAGLGLAFIDLAVLLTAGRGGRFVDADGGTLRYEPSGLEPRLHVGSRRGVPYHCKPSPHRLGTPPELPRFVTAATVDEVLARHDQLDFREDVVPLLSKEIAWAYYQELFTGHPEHVGSTWAKFADRFAPLAWGDPELDALVTASVPDPVDRLDLDALDRPLRGVRCPDHATLQARVRDHIRGDIDRRTSARYSADVGAFAGFLSVLGQLPRVLAAPTLSARSRVEGFDRWWFGFFSSYASGPPRRRLEELLALAEAGIVDFLGAELWVDTDEAADVFRAGGATGPGVVEARALVEARLPAPSVHNTRDPLLAALAARGDARELVLHDDGARFPTGMVRAHPSDGRLIGRDDQPHPRRYALGPHTGSRSGAFARPRTNSPIFRANDAAARSILRTLADLHPSPVPLATVSGPHQKGD
jgi:hypothetical protein